MALRIIQITLPAERKKTLEQIAAAQSSWLHGAISLGLLVIICVIIYYTKGS